MKILLVSATSKEIATAAKHLGMNTLIEAALIEGGNAKHQINLLITGIGIGPSAFQLGYWLSRNDFDFAIQAGLAGSFSAEFAPGSLVQINQDCFAETGLLTDSGFKTLGQLGLPDNSGWITNPFTLSGLPAVKGITVNTISGTDYQKNEYVRQFEPVAETMEGASFLMACRFKHLPCLQLRAISNFTGKRNPQTEAFESAMDKLNHFLIQLIEQDEF